MGVSLAKSLCDAWQIKQKLRGCCMLTRVCDLRNFRKQEITPQLGEMFEETGLFRKLIFWNIGPKSPPPAKGEVFGRNFYTSPGYDVIYGFRIVLRIT